MLNIFPKGYLSNSNEASLSYKITGDPNDRLVFVHDHMPEPDFSQWENDNINTINDIINFTNYKNNYIFCESYLKWEDFPNFITTPNFFFSTCIIYQNAIDTSVYEYTDQTNVLCLMHKKRPNRVLVSAWLNENTCDLNYTQGFFPDEIIQDELLRYSKYTYLKSSLPKKFLLGNLIPKTRNPNLDNKDLVTWNAFKDWYLNSTFNIITEPNFFERGCTITEKYLCCLYGYCFPIFCGSYKLPDAVKEIGFDVFDDIIDHSYQYETNPTVRTLNALELNKNLLMNPLVKKRDYIKRHENNLKLVRQNLESTIDNFYEPIKKLSEQIDLSSVLNLKYFKPFTKKTSYSGFS